MRHVSHALLEAALASEHLKEAADILRASSWPKGNGDWERSAVSDSHIGPVYLMLTAFAVELVLKALIATKNRMLSEDGLCIEVKTHKLLNLCEMANLKMCPEFTRLLKRLSVYVTSGRYPVTVSIEDMDERATTEYAASVSFDLIDRLWSYLLEEVGEHPSLQM